MVLGDEITVSIGEIIRVTVPDLIGSTLEEATADLQALGLNVLNSGFVQPSPSLGLEGDVAQQDPEPGLQLPDGSTVRVWIGLAQVPDVIGVERDLAVLAIEATGLIAVDGGTTTTADADLDGTIATLTVDGSPAELTWWEVGTEVTYVVYEFVPPPTTTTTTTTAAPP